MGDLTSSFSKSDMQCKCSACASDELRPYTKIEVVKNLQRVRDAFGGPILVSRGVSCAAHNAAVGGAPDSRHLPEHADAVDVVCHSPATAWRLVWLAMSFGSFTAIRVYKDHVHFDGRDGPKIFLSSPE